MIRFFLPMFYRFLSWTIYGEICGRKIKLRNKIFSFSADPFFISDKWGSFLLYEEKKIWRKGLIRILNIDTKKSIVLRESFHLSFPFIFKYKGSWMLLPESSENGDLRFYELNTEEMHIDFKFNIRGSDRFVDSVVFNIDENKDTIHLLSTRLDAAGLIYIELCMRDKIILVQENIDTSGYSYERNGGLIVKNNRKYLVEQRRGNKGYGHYRVVHDIVFNNGKYILGNSRLMLNTHSRNHHYYEVNGSYVEDGMHY